MTKPQMFVPVTLDTKALVDLRLLLSQIGFAIDNYLTSQEQNTGVERDPGPILTGRQKRKASNTGKERDK